MGSIAAYEEVRVIGRGAYGTAHVVRERESKKQYVMKKISLGLMDAKEIATARAEVTVLKDLDHFNIVKYIDSFEENESMHIVMYYCEGGDLAHQIKQAKKNKERLPETQVLDWFIQLCLALKYIHSKHILHRDLKPNNVFLTSRNVVKLGDFGVARVLDDTMEKASTVIGTPFYMSPEVCQELPYSYSSDIWALGCVLYEMCTLAHAFHSNNLISLACKIVDEDYAPIPSGPDGYSDSMASLLRVLLEKDPAKRFSAEQILELPFIKSRMREMSNDKDSTLGKKIKRVLHKEIPEDASGHRASRIQMRGKSASAHAKRLEEEAERQRLEAARLEALKHRAETKKRREREFRPTLGTSMALSEADKVAMGDVPRRPISTAPPSSLPTEMPSSRPTSSESPYERTMEIGEEFKASEGRRGSAVSRVIAKNRGGVATPTGMSSHDEEFDKDHRRPRVHSGSDDYWRKEDSGGDHKLAETMEIRRGSARPGGYRRESKVGDRKAADEEEDDRSGASARGEVFEWEESGDEEEGEASMDGDSFFTPGIATVRVIHPPRAEEDRPIRSSGRYDTGTLPDSIATVKRSKDITSVATSKVTSVKGSRPVSSSGRDGDDRPIRSSGSYVTGSLPAGEAGFSDEDGEASGDSYPESFESDEDSMDDDTIRVNKSEVEALTTLLRAEVRDDPRPTSRKHSVGSSAVSTPKAGGTPRHAALKEEGKAGGTPRVTPRRPGSTTAKATRIREAEEIAALKEQIQVGLADLCGEAEGRETFDKMYQGVKDDPALTKKLFQRKRNAALMTWLLKMETLVYKQQTLEVEDL